MAAPDGTQFPAAATYAPRVPLPAQSSSPIRWEQLGNIQKLFPPAPGTPTALTTQPIHSYGPGVIPPQPSALPPLRQGRRDSMFQTAVCHHLDRPQIQPPRQKLEPSTLLREWAKYGFIAPAVLTHFLRYYALESQGGS